MIPAGDSKLQNPRLEPLISITLPSIFPDALARTLYNLRDATRVSHQIIVVSPFEPPDIVGSSGKIIWVKETEPRGSNAGHAAALPHATGQFITPWVDDHIYADGWDVETIDDFRAMEGTNDFFVLGLRQAYPQVGTVFGLYYPYFPFMRRHTTQSLGWYDPNYKMDFADCDLGLRVYAAKGDILWARYSVIVVHPDDQRKEGRPVCDVDMNKFISKWKSVFGVGWKTADIRDFNLDIDIRLTPPAQDDRIEIQGRTVRPAKRMKM